jgi:serine/threonine protein kinase
MSNDVPSELRDHPRYRVLKLLGQGGMGAVYLAEHLRMKRKVALKVINSNFLGAEQGLARFHKEVEAAAALSHPNIVQAYDADEAGKLHFFVMEYVEGTDVSAHLKTQGTLPIAQACGIIRQAALGLQHAHEAGMVHRDIKPHNLMLTKKGEVKILDFGLARFAKDSKGDGQLTGTGVVMGTADYIAPEQTSDSRQVDIRADIYSLGCTLYQLLSGKVPFPTGSVIEKMIKHAIDQPPSLATLCPQLPDSLIRIVAKMMAKAPEQRYQTPEEVALALASFVTPGTAESMPALPSVSQPPAVSAPTATPAPKTITIAKQAEGTDEEIDFIRDQEIWTPRKKSTKPSDEETPVRWGVGVWVLIALAVVLALMMLVPVLLMIAYVMR